jgi:apolipoprotein N-acyltransferase
MTSLHEKAYDFHMLKRHLLPILSGLLIGTSYIPFPPWALFFCLIPLWLYVLRTSDVKKAFWGGWLTQFILNAIGFHWVAYTTVEFGHYPWIVGILVLIVFCAFAHLYFPASVALFVWINNRWPMKPVAGVFLLAGLLSLFKNLFPVLFPWHFGYPWLWAHFPGMHFADVIGFEGLDFLSIIINALLTLAWIALPNRKKSWQFAGAAVALFASINVAGFLKKDSWNYSDAEIKILAIQGNIGNFEKLAAEKGAGFQQDIINRYTNLTSEGLRTQPDADAIIWPETAYPELLDSYKSRDPESASLRSYLKSIQKPLLTGGYSRDQRTRQTYNGFFVLNADGTNAMDPPYRKTLLLAFGEYFPGADLFPFVMKLFPDQSAFGRGPGPTLMPLGEWKFGPQICYEGLYPWFTRGLVERGAEIFVNVTNDSWFGSTFEPHQHLYMTLARAIEFRRPLMRATNTGITTAVLANGTILTKSPLHQEWQGVFHIPYRRNPPKTVYTYIEPYWLGFLVAFVVALFAFGRKRSTPTIP